MHGKWENELRTWTVLFRGAQSKICAGKDENCEKQEIMMDLWEQKKKKKKIKNEEKSTRIRVGTGCLREETEKRINLVETIFCAPT